MKSPKLIPIVAALLFSQVSIAQIPVNGPAENWTIQQIQEETTSVSTTLNTFGNALLATMRRNIEKLLSAMSVATKQESVSSNDFQKNITDSSTAFVNAMRAQQQMGIITKAYVDFNPLTGQGYDPCGTAAKTKQLDKSYSVLVSQATNTMRNVPVLNGHLVDSTQKWANDQVQNHRAKFCSQSEADAGLCTLSSVPSGDTNSALFFESVNDNSLKKEARLAFINNLMGAPFQKISGTPTNLQAQQYLFEQNRYTSLMSIPAYSFAMIDAEHTRSEGLNQSPIEQLDSRIGTYFGGEDAAKWASSIAVQAPRGLLVETAKIEGLAAWQNFKMVEQNNRILANIAALTLASSDPLKANLDSKVRQATGTASANAINGAIK